MALLEDYDDDDIAIAMGSTGIKMMNHGIELQEMEVCGV